MADLATKEGREILRRDYEIFWDHLRDDQKMRELILAALDLLDQWDEEIQGWVEHQCTICGGMEAVKAYYNGKVSLKDLAAVYPPWAAAFKVQQPSPVWLDAPDGPDNYHLFDYNDPETGVWQDYIYQDDQGSLRYSNSAELVKCHDFDEGYVYMHNTPPAPPEG